MPKIADLDPFWSYGGLLVCLDLMYLVRCWGWLLQGARRLVCPAIQGRRPWGITSSYRDLVMFCYFERFFGGDEAGCGSLGEGGRGKEVCRWWIW